MNTHTDTLIYYYIIVYIYIYTYSHNIHIHTIIPRYSESRSQGLFSPPPWGRVCGASRSLFRSLACWVRWGCPDAPDHRGRGTSGSLSEHATRNFLSSQVAWYILDHLGRTCSHLQPFSPNPWWQPRQWVLGASGGPLLQERQQILETGGLKQRLELVLDAGDVGFFSLQKQGVVTEFTDSYGGFLKWG